MSLTKDAILNLRTTGFDTAEVAARRLTAVMDTAQKTVGRTSPVAIAAAAAVTKIGPAGTGAGAAVSQAMAVASAAMQKARASADQAAVAVANVGGGAAAGGGGMFAGISGAMGKIAGPAAAAAGAVYAVKRAGDSLFDAFGNGERLEALQEAFSRLTVPIGGATAVMESLRRATRGEVDDQNLMLATNKLMIADLGLSKDQLEKLAGAALAMSRVMNTDAATAMRDLGEGIQKQSSNILDNLGIVVRSEEALHAYAKAHKIAAADIDGHTKKAIYLAEAMKGLDAAQKLAGSSAATLASANLSTNWKNATDDLDKYIAKQKALIEIIRAGQAGVIEGAKSIGRGAVPALVGAATMFPGAQGMAFAGAQVGTGISGKDWGMLASVGGPALAQNSVVTLAPASIMALARALRGESPLANAFGG